MPFVPKNGDAREAVAVVAFLMAAAGGPETTAEADPNIVELPIAITSPIIFRPPAMPKFNCVEIFPKFLQNLDSKWWASSSPAWGGTEGQHRRRELPFGFCRSSEGVDKGREPMAGGHVCSSHPGFYTTRTPIPRLEQPLPAQIHWPFSFKSSNIECVSNISILFLQPCFLDIF